MPSVKHRIHEYDVISLRAALGDWPAGTEGTAGSIYEDAALIELSTRPSEETLDNLVAVPADKFEVVWRAGDLLRRDMEA